MYSSHLLLPEKVPNKFGFIYDLPCLPDEFTPVVMIGYEMNIFWGENLSIEHLLTFLYTYADIDTLHNWKKNKKWRNEDHGKEIKQNS